MVHGWWRHWTALQILQYLQLKIWNKISLEVRFRNIPKIVFPCVQLVNIFQYEDEVYQQWVNIPDIFLMTISVCLLSDVRWDLLDQASMISAWRSEEGGAGGLTIKVPAGGGAGGPGGGEGGGEGEGEGEGEGGQVEQYSTWLHCSAQTGWGELIGNILSQDNTYQHLPTVWNYKSITGEY